MLLVTGWSVTVGAFHFDSHRDGLAAFTLATGILLVAVGALHHRGLRGGAGTEGVHLEVPPIEDPAEITARLAALSIPPPLGSIADDEADDGARFYLANHILETHIAQLMPPLDDCNGQVWLLDEETDLLVGILPPAHAGESSFEIGQGAVGQAWTTQEYVLATGDAVADDTFNLSDEQKHRYSDLTAAAAIPIENAAGEMIGVLSASSTTASTRLTEQEGLELLTFLSQLAARVLVDLLKWFDDRYDHTPGKEP